MNLNNQKNFLIMKSPNFKLLGLYKGAYSINYHDF